MTGYKVFLSKSRKGVEHIIDIFDHHAPCDMSVQHGVLIADDRIPRIYHDKGYYYCVVTYANVSETFHEIVFK